MIKFNINTVKACTAAICAIFSLNDLVGMNPNDLARINEVLPSAQAEDFLVSQREPHTYFIKGTCSSEYGREIKVQIYSDGSMRIGNTLYLSDTKQLDMQTPLKETGTMDFEQANSKSKMAISEELAELLLLATENKEAFAEQVSRQMDKAAKERSEWIDRLSDSFGELKFPAETNYLSEFDFSGKLAAILQTVNTDFLESDPTSPKTKESNEEKKDSE